MSKVTGTRTLIRMALRSSPFHGSLSSYISSLYKKIGHDAPVTTSSLSRNCLRVLEQMIRLTREFQGTIYSLFIIPIDSCRAKKKPRSWMRKSSIHFHVARKRWIQWLGVRRSDPVNNRALQSLCVIGPSTIGPLLNLDVNVREAKRYRSDDEPFLLWLSLPRHYRSKCADEA
jgi:hypothetical protein